MNVVLREPHPTSIAWVWVLQKVDRLRDLRVVLAESAKFRLDIRLEMVEASAGRIEGTLLFLGTAMVHKRSTVVADHVVEPCIDGAFA